jgi:hypothetical protein
VKNVTLSSKTTHFLHNLGAFLCASTSYPASSNSKKVRQKVITMSSGLSHATQQIRKECAKKPLQSAAGCHTRPSKFKFKKNAPKAITTCRGLSHPTQIVQIRKKCAKRPLLPAAGCHTEPSKFKFEKSAPSGHYYLQRAVTPNSASSNSIKVCQKAITICSRLSHPTQQVQIRKKCAKR